MILTREIIQDIYERKGAVILRRCQLILRNKVLADDALQEVFVRLLLYGAPCENGDVPLAWLYRTAERCCFNQFKKTKREPVVNSDDLEWISAGIDEREKIEAFDTISKLFHKLKPKLMQVAVLYYVDGLTQESIAAELGWSRRTVGKKIKKLGKIVRVFRERNTVK